LSLVPIAVLSVEVLPTYSMLARFLSFYAPLMCFLALAYLLYIREVLERVMFARILRDPEPYYPAPLAVRGKRLGDRLIRGAFNLLPVVLVVASLACMSRYFTRLNDSVALASAVLVEQKTLAKVIDPEMAATKISDADIAPMRATGSSQGDTSRIAAVRGVPLLIGDSLRTYTLTTATIDDIPYFVELTGFFTGGMVCAVAAVFLVLLKEYARRTLGLSEAELLEGRSFDEASLAPNTE
jgi:hypothetical protein